MTHPSDTPIHAPQAFTLPTWAQLKRPVMVATIVAGWMTAYAWLAYQPTYESQATVLIKDSAVNNQYLDKTQYFQQQTTTANSSNPVLNTMGLLRSAKVMNALYTFLKTEYPDELKAMGIKNYKQWQAFYKDGHAVLDAENEMGTDLIHVNLGWTDPVIARDALRVALEAFRQASVEVNRSQHRLQRQYLEEQLAGIEKQLFNLRDKKSGFKQAQGTVSLATETENLVETKITLENKLSELRAQSAGASSALNRYESMMGMNAERALKASAIGLNGTLKGLNETRYELAEQEAQLGATLTDKNPKLKEVRDQLAQVTRDIDAETRRTLGSNYRTGDQNLMVADTTRGNVTEKMVLSKAEANRLNAEAAQTAARLAQINAKLGSLPGLEKSMSQIDQEEASLSNALDAIRQKALEARVKEAQTVSNVFVVDPARMPVKPAFPSQKTMNILGVFAALVAGAAAFIIEQRYGVFIARLVTTLKATLVGLKPANTTPFRTQLPVKSVSEVPTALMPASSLVGAASVDQVAEVQAPKIEPHVVLPQTVAALEDLAMRSPNFEEVSNLPMHEGWQSLAKKTGIIKPEPSDILETAEAIDPESSQDMAEALEPIETRPSELIRPRSRNQRRKKARLSAASGYGNAASAPALAHETASPDDLVLPSMASEFSPTPSASVGDASPALSLVTSSSVMSYWDRTFEPQAEDDLPEIGSQKTVISQTQDNLALQPEAKPEIQTQPEAPGAVVRRAARPAAGGLMPFLPGARRRPSVSQAKPESKSGGAEPDSIRQANRQELIAAFNALSAPTTDDMTAMRLERAIRKVAGASANSLNSWSMPQSPVRPQ